MKYRILFTFSFFILIFSFTLIFHPEPAEGALVGVTRTGSSSPITNGLVSWWTFDGKDVVNGALIDKSSSGNNGIIYNISTSTFYVQGKIGQAGNFDGVNDYVRHNTTVGSSYTVSFWFKYSSYAGNMNIIGSGWHSPYSYYYLPTGSCPGSGCKITLYDGGYRSNNTEIIKNRWYHLSMVVNGTLLTYYLNGNPDGTPTVTLNGFSAIDYIAGTGGAGTFKGSIDDIRIYNRALSAQEIKVLYYLGGSKMAVSQSIATTTTPGSVSSGSPQGLSSGLVGYWTFDGKDMVNGVAQDKSGRGNNGKLVNISTSTFYSAGKIGQGANFGTLSGNVGVNAGHSSSLDTLPAMTYSAWVKANFAGGSFVQKNNTASKGWGVSWQSTSGTRSIAFSRSFSSVNMFSASAYATMSTSTMIGKWHHIAVVWDGGLNANTNVHFYRDGVELAKGSGLSNGVGDIVSDTTGDVIIGNVRLLNNSTGSSLDDVRIYNRALSVQEINELYNLGGSKIATSQNIATTTTPGSVSSGSPQGLSSGLVGYWTFDGKDMASGVAQDKSGSGNNAKLTSIATSTFYVAGKIGQGVKFDTVLNSRVTLPRNPITTMANPSSICAWVLINNRAVLGSGGGEQTIVTLDTNTSNRIRISNWRTPVGSIYATYFIGNAEKGAKTTNSVLTNNKWSHFCSIFNGTNVSIYVDGASVATSTTVNNTSAGNVIGNRTDGLGTWGGNIDDVRIYNRTLSATEVKQLYNMGR